MKTDKKNLGHITQISKILKTLKEEGKILNFGKVEKTYYQGLMFRIFLDQRRSFDLRIQLSQRPNILFGAEIARSTGWEVVIFVGQNCTPKRIFHLLKQEFLVRRDGLVLEVLFQKQVEKLIVEDKEFSAIVSSILEASQKEDISYCIDRFLILSNGMDVPVQIKSSISGQTVHKKKGTLVPSLVYFKSMPDDILKNKIFKICDGYQKCPKQIEHI